MAGIAIAGAVSIAAACGSDHGESDDSGTLPVVATTTVVADIIENVGGEDVEVTTLVGRETDAHAFEPEPTDSTAIADAEIVFEVGRGFEEWLDSAVEASGGDAEVLTLSDSVETIEAGEDAHSDEEGDEAHSEEEDEDADAHRSEDPHVWMTAANGVLMTATVADALAAVDPDNAEAYQERAAAYEEQLEAAQAEIASTLEPLTPDQRILFTNHDAFGYFAAEHDFEVLGSALSSVTTESADPSAADVAAIVEEIEASGARAIFPENVANPELLETIAREAGVTVGPELATGALGEEGSATGTYLGLLQSNAEAIGAALS